MIDTSKIKSGDEVQVDNSPNWREVWVNEPNEIAIYFGDGFLQKIHYDLITNHRPAEPVVPKGEGCVDWDKDVWHLNQEGEIEQIDDTRRTQWFCEMAQGNISNNRQHLERKRERQRIKQELLECDGAVYEPVASDENDFYFGLDRDAFLECCCLREEAYQEFIVCFINEETTVDAIYKVGAERIRRAWGLDDAR